MNGEDPAERPDYITAVINGLERYNPEAVGTLETYLQEQCEQKFSDCNANRTLLKLQNHTCFLQPYLLDISPTKKASAELIRKLCANLSSYQLNPDRMKDEVVTNILVKAMTNFPSSQFTLALHLINPSAASSGELHEAITKLRSLNSQLQGAQYADFWADLDGDDLCADLIADVSGFEDLVRERIASLVAQAFREIQLSHLVSWLGVNEDKTRKFITEVAGWTIDDEGIVKIPANPDNEAKKSEIREDVNVDQFARVIRRAWEETV
ncbi:ARM repeat-containing protein [Trichoderma longibrachiatum ATCC 18648]|uniref:Eukaryotic translation initiation factor 3 subunit K n=1 Tax=Trichoderma longibrachiatum ATCC 18648 TaxID=983965 RepID=A0A2T4C6R1_TRILO|nr:ARM repeat-containing protein [Trichoderma longibrachiatum ATCC 18648]